MNKTRLLETVQPPHAIPVRNEYRLCFLCSYHKDWVYFNSQAALEHLDEVQVKGEILVEHQRWIQALPFIGGAWETTDILLQLNGAEYSHLVNRFCVLTVLLCTCMEKTGREDCARQVYQQSIGFLSALAKQLDKTGEHYDYIMCCLEQLSRHVHLQVYLIPWPQQTTEVQLHQASMGSDM